MGSTESDIRIKRLAVILGVVLLVHGLILFALIQIKSSPKVFTPTKNIAVRLVQITQDHPQPSPPKPIEKPKVVPVVQDQPKPKPLPVLAAPKAAVTPAAVPQVERPIDKPIPPQPVATPPTQAVPAPQKVEPASPKVVQGVAYIVQPDVQYPDAANGATGTTIVRALINANGLVDEVTIQTRSGNALLDRAALQAVKKARFKPYRENGVAQTVYTLIPIAYVPPDEE